MSKLIVVKLGGEIVASQRLPAIARDVRSLVEGGARVVMVHGGGPQATELGKRLGIAARIVGGRRVTDDATLEVVKMTLGRLNVDLVAALRAAGVRAVGMLGAVEAVRRPPRVVSGGGPDPVDFGWVGEVTGLDRALLDFALDAGRVPVLACLGAGTDLPGAVYNINADTVANRAAVELAADALILITNTDGVRKRVDDPASRIPRLTIAEGRAAIADGTVAGGMIPKLEESFEALAEGVRSILIVAGDLAQAVANPGSVGTRIEP